jgi:hypothetical protein
LLFGVPCNHSWQKRTFPPINRKNLPARVVGVYGKGSKGHTIALWSRAMGITWMTRAEIVEAIPPAYTEFIGRQLIAIMERI